VRLEGVEHTLEEVRLAIEDTPAVTSPEVERDYLRRHRLTSSKRGLATGNTDWLPGTECALRGGGL